MEGDEVTQQQIRQYLLGKLESAADCETIELLLLTSAEFFERFEAEESELVQDYVDGKLTKPERASFENHYLTSPERLEDLQFARLLRAGLNELHEPSPIPREVRAHDWRGKFTDKFRVLKFPKLVFSSFLLLLLMLGGAGLLYWRIGSFDSDQTKSLALANEVYRAGRPFAARVTELDYAPYLNVRGNAVETRATDTRLAEAELLLLNRVNRAPAASDLHALGRLYLLKKQFDQALLQFEKARAHVGSEPSAALLSDLGVVHLERGRTLADPGAKLTETLRALEFLEESLKLQPAERTALFNKALTLEALNLTGEARLAWERYLEIDTDSPWSAEARHRRQLLVGIEAGGERSAKDVLADYLAAFRARDADGAYRVVSAHREMITGKLIWQQLAFAYLETNDPEMLAGLVFLGEVETVKSGDRFVAELSRFYSRVLPAAKPDLRRAGQLIAAGYRFCMQGQDDLGLENFRKARALYQSRSDELEVNYCDYWIGYCLARTSRITESIRGLDKLVNRLRVKNYKWLISQVSGWQTLNMITQQEFTKALAANDAAYRAAVEVSDLYNTQKSLFQRATIYRFTKNYAKAVEYTARSLTAVADAPAASLRQKWRSYHEMSEMLYGMNRASLAESYQKEALSIARILDDPSFISSSQMNLGVIVTRLGRKTEGLERFAASRATIGSFAESPLRDEVLNLLNLFTANSLRAGGNCRAALEYYAAAERHFEQKRAATDLYEIRKGQVLCHHAEKNEAAFEDALAALLDNYRRNRTRILDEQNRSLYFDSEQDIYDIAALSAVEKNDYEQAFNYAEESRARSLLDFLNALGKIERRDGAAAAEAIFPSEMTATPLSVKEIQRQLPADLQLVQYAVLHDRTLIWTFDRDRLEMAVSEIGTGELKNLIESFRSELVALSSQRPADATESPLASRLYERLILPVENRLDREKTICFVPDKDLLKLPFGALIEPASREYLIKRYRFMTAPSASVLINNTRRAEQLRRISLTASAPGETMLAVGDPAFDSDRFPQLNRLPAARREARAIGAFYQRGEVLTQELATRARILANIKEADYLHYAGHYIVREGSPLESGVLTTPASFRGGDDSGLLSNHEILNRPFKHLKLAILSSCQSGIEDFLNGEGALGGGRTYLAAGVPAVIASQWNVDSEATAELMISFHRFRQAEKLPTVEALRRAQLRMLDHPQKSFRNPYFWAAFSLNGGYPTY